MVGLTEKLDQKMTDPLQVYDFPPELNIHIVDKTIELTTSAKTGDATAKLCSKYQVKNLLLQRDRKNQKKYTIRGGDLQSRIEYLLDLLDELKLFTAVNVLPYPREILSFIYPQITQTSTKEEVIAIMGEDLNKFQTIPNQIASDVKKLTECPLIVSPKEALALSSIFCPSKTSFLHSIVRNHGVQSDEDVVQVNAFQLNIPMPISVGFQRLDWEHFRLTFTSVQTLSAQSIHDLVAKAVQTINSKPCFSSKFTQCDEIHPENLSKLEKENHVHIIDVPSQSTAESDLEDCTLYFLFSQPDNSQKELVQKIVNKLFEDIRLVLCKNCKMMFNPNEKGSPCEETYHPGKRIPFEGTNDMEQIEFDEESQTPITIVCYDCCGEVEIDAPGCKSRKNAGGHKKDENAKEISSMTPVNEAPFSQQ